MSTFERRHRSLVANLRIIQGELQRLIEDMQKDQPELTPAESVLLHQARGENVKLDGVIKEMKMA